MICNARLLLVFLCLCSCGFKGPPIPIFPTSSTQAEDEVKLRNLNQQLEKKEQEKIKQDKIKRQHP